MTKYVALLAILTALAAPDSIVASGTVCSNLSLSDAQILEIVKSDIVQRGGSFDPKDYRYRIERENCGYRFFAEKPNERGNHFAVSIDEKGKIVKRPFGR
jgi:hypothetical protein